MLRITLLDALVLQSKQGRVAHPSDAPSPCLAIFVRRWGYSTETVRSVFQVMSTRSPTLTLSNTVGSTTRLL